MKRVFIVGSGGSGKTTLGNTIASHIGCDATQLDALFWQDDWIPSPIEDFKQRVVESTSGETWVLDGNYRNTVFDDVFDRADTFIWLNLPKWTILWRCLKRDILKKISREKYFGKNCPPTLSGSIKLLVFVYRTHEERNASLKLKATEARSKNKEVVVLNKPKEVQEFIEERITCC